jgi:hypothetical protein
MHTVVYGVHVRFWPTLAACHVQGWPEPCISAAYDRVLDEIPAKNKSIYRTKSIPSRKKYSFCGLIVKFNRGRDDHLSVRYSICL